ncbi:MAG: divergent polysaccharide deacetylase family protein [Synergistetes bacterium]|nr:divergent polysaccharide deacetylase family protein [Synergistota bacterium]
MRAMWGFALILIAFLMVIVLFLLSPKPVKLCFKGKLSGVSGAGYKITYFFRLRPIGFSFNLWGELGRGLYALFESIKPRWKSKLPKLAFIIDDFGYRTPLALDFISLPYKITVSVLPFLPWSKFIAERAHLSGKEVMLHLPMEAYGHRWAGVGTIRVNMKEREIRKIIEDALMTVPHTVGVNNHMGSLATESAPLMRKVMRVLKEKGLFFVDSCTSHKTVAYAIARSMGLPSYYNSLFIDSYSGESKAEEYIWKLVWITRRKKRVIGIGHVRHDTYVALERLLPKIRRFVELVFASNIVYGNGVVAR